MNLSATQRTVAVILLLVFAIFVWPTAYRYDHLRRGNFETLTRTNRFTGNVQCNGDAGWNSGC